MLLFPGYAFWVAFFALSVYSPLLSPTVARLVYFSCGPPSLVVPVAVCGVYLFQEYEETCLFTKHESLQGDSPRVHPNILKCSLHSLVTKGIRLVGFATRAMVSESPTHCLILNSLTFARGRVILRSHFLILLLLIILISHHIHS